MVKAFPLCSFAFAVALAAPLGAQILGERPEESRDESGVPADLLAWAAGLSDEAATRLRLLGSGPADAAANVRRLAAFVSEYDERVASLLSLLGSLDAGSPPAPPEWLRGGGLPDSARASVALVAADELHARRCYGEVLAWLEGIDAEAAPAPHLVHYYRAVAHHQLVELEAAKEQARALLACGDAAARRRLALAELILRDAGGAPAEPETPGHIARQMNDIRRRLNLGRSADPELELQQRVIDALEKLIEQAEQQQQQQQQQASSGTPSAPSTPMQDSRPAELKGPGDVDRREIAAGGDWGSLPPEERERVTQQIGRDFPAYYRDVIEAYFRSLADRNAETDVSEEESP